MLKNKTLLITGGTGSFGNAVLNRFLDTDHFSEIRVFSRDEKKQEDQRRRLSHPKVKFYIGDVRDPLSVETAVRGVDYIFHAAALKQVPSCEFFPIEAVKTNVIGTENVLESAIRNKVKNVVVLSTDKAVYPINAMGISKAMAIHLTPEGWIDELKTYLRNLLLEARIAGKGGIGGVEVLINETPMPAKNIEPHDVRRWLDLHGDHESHVVHRHATVEAQMGLTGKQVIHPYHIHIKFCHFFPIP